MSDDEVENAEQYEEVSAFMHNPYFIIDGFLANPNITEFIVVESKDKVYPEFYKRSKDGLFCMKWIDRFQTNDVILATMIEHYYCIGYVLKDSIKTLEESPLVFVSSASGYERTIKLYYKQDNDSDELKSDLAKCSLVIDVAAQNPILPTKYLEMLPEQFDLCCSSQDTRYNLEQFDIFKGRVVNVYDIYNLSLYLDYAILGPYREGLHNLVLQSILYPAKRRDVDANNLQSICVPEKYKSKVTTSTN